MLVYYLASNHQHMSTTVKINKNYTKTWKLPASVSESSGFSVSIFVSSSSLSNLVSDSFIPNFVSDSTVSNLLAHSFFPNFDSDSSISGRSNSSISDGIIWSFAGSLSRGFLLMWSKSSSLEPDSTSTGFRFLFP